MARSKRPAQGNNSRKKLVIRTFQKFRRDGKVLPPRKAQSVAGASAGDRAEVASGRGSARDRAEAHAQGRKSKPRKKAGRMKRKGGRG